MAEADLGECPICGRPMLPGASVDRHHFVPRSEGGRETSWVHRICHRKLHSLFTERELARFIRWVERKHPEFRARTATAKARRRR